MDSKPWMLLIVVLTIIASCAYYCDFWKFRTKKPKKQYHKRTPRYWIKYHMVKWKGYDKKEPNWIQKGKTTHIYVPAKNRKHFHVRVNELEKLRHQEVLDDFCQRM